MAMQNCSRMQATQVESALSTKSTDPAGASPTGSSTSAGAGSTAIGSPMPPISPNGINVPTSTTDICLTSAPGNPKGVSAAQLRHYVGLDKIAACGDGVTVAVIFSAGTTNITADLATYSTAMGLPVPDANHFQVLIGGGGSCAANAPPLESHIDVEMVHALAPNAKILLVCGSDSSATARGRVIEYAITTGGADIVSMSWGSPESQADMDILEPIFQAHPDVLFLAGSGDSGSNDLNGAPRVAYPASSPEVLAVGATADDGGENLNAWVRSGGGISAFFARPAWQDALNSIAGLAGTMRLVPDLAMNGSDLRPTAIYGASGWTNGYGTSVSTPIAAGFFAIVNQIYGRRMGDLHAKLYALLPSQLNYFRDVVTGSNGDYRAGPGYDMLTGLGTPRAQTIIPGFQ